MGQSLTKQYVHLVFHIKTTSVKLNPVHHNVLYLYIAGIIRLQQGFPIIINGTSDHIHILCSISKNQSLSKLIQQIKQDSSQWIKTLDNYYRNFSWQKGYGGFSVCPYNLKNTIRYIERQKEHHNKRSFQEEYLLLLKDYNIEFNEDYIWTD